jgi:site-specific recombinase XerD
VKQPTMLARAEAYITARRAFGFELRLAAAAVRRFARYVDASGYRGPITTEVALRWACDAPSTMPLCRARRLEVVRCFARYQAGVEADTEIPPARLLGPRSGRRSPYMYTDAEIEGLMNAAARLRSPRGLRAHTYTTLIGLLACAGLRISDSTFALTPRC